MFELNNHTVKLTSVNPRAEIHGEDRRPAFDLKFEAQCSSYVLIQFHPELRQILYKKNEAPDLVDQISPDALTSLRFSKMGAVKWEHEYSGYKVTVDYGLGGQSDIKLGECKVDNFKFVPQEGGTVVVLFRVIAHPETPDVGRLCEFIQRDVDVSVEPPAPETIQELFGDDKEAA